MTPLRRGRVAILRHLAGPMGIVLVALTLLAYGALALAPFRWSPPHRVPNGAATSSDGLRFPAPGLARSAEAPPWLETAAARGRLDVDLRLRTHSPVQDGPAAIFTVSRNLHLANLTLCQAGPDLVLRLRRRGSTPNGKPMYTVPGALRDTGWHDVTIAIEPGRLRLSVDGRVALDAALPAGALAGWSLRHHVSLGNELNGHRPWRGEVARAVVRIDGTSTDYVTWGALDVPRTFWSLPNPPQWLPDERETLSVGDWIANFASFAFLGFLLGGRTRGAGGWVHAVLVCSLLSLGVEVAQVFFSRHPAFTDWVLNTLGGAAGAAIARGLVHRPPAPPTGAPRPVPAAAPKDEVPS